MQSFLESGAMKCCVKVLTNKLYIRTLDRIADETDDTSSSEDGSDDTSLENEVSKS